MALMTSKYVHRLVYDVYTVSTCFEVQNLWRWN